MESRAKREIEPDTSAPNKISSEVNCFPVFRFGLFSQVHFVLCAYPFISIPDVFVGTRQWERPQCLKFRCVHTAIHRARRQTQYQISLLAPFCGENTAI